VEFWFVKKLKFKIGIENLWGYGTGPKFSKKWAILMINLDLL
jgi:hypothetical protein